MAGSHEQVRFMTFVYHIWQSLLSDGPQMLRNSGASVACEQVPLIS